MCDKIKEIRQTLRQILRKFEPVKEAIRVTCVVDTGDFGYDMCSNCGKTLPDITITPDYCPFCGAIFTGRTVSPPSGGSDF